MSCLNEAVPVRCGDAAMHGLFRCEDQTNATTLNDSPISEVGLSMSQLGDRLCPQCSKPVKPALSKCMECGYRFPIAKAATAVRVDSPPTTKTAASSTPATVTGRSGSVSSSGPRIIGASHPPHASRFSTAPSIARATESRSLPVTADRPVAPVASAAPRTPIKPSTGTPSVVSQELRSEVSTRLNRTELGHVGNVPHDSQQAQPTPRPEPAVVTTTTESVAETNDLLKVSCECGATFRVKPEWAGRRRKCTKCSRPILVPQAEADFDADEMADQLALEDEVNAAIRKLESSASEVTLKKTASSLTLKKLEKQLPVVSVFNEAEAQKRRAAIIELGQTHDVRAWELIQTCAKDEFAIVRSGVALAIGELADRRGLPTLVSYLLDKSEDVANDAIRALKSFPEPLLVRPLLRMGLTNPMQKLHASETLSHMGNAILPVLLDVVQRRDRGMLLDAIVLLGRMGDGAAVPVLLDALSHTTGPLRAYTVEALGRIGDKRAVGAMIDLLQDPDEVMQFNAIMALERFADARAMKPLLAVLESESRELRRRAVIALGRIGDPRASQAIQALLPNADESEREAILETLCLIGDEKAAEILVPLLAEPLAEQQRAILSWIKRTKPSNVLAALIPIIQNAAVAVRKQAADVLGEYSEPESVEALEELVTDPAAEVRAAALKSLAKTAGKKAIPVIEQALRGEASVRCAAVIALGSLKDSNTLPALLAMLRDPLPEVRYHCVKTIGKLGAKHAATAIAPLLEDADDMVREAAKKAFADLELPVPSKSFGRRLSKLAHQLMPDAVASMLPKPAVMGGIAAVAVLVVGTWFFGLSSRWRGSNAYAANLAGEVMSIVAISDTQLAAWSNMGTVKLWNAVDGKSEKELAVGRGGKFLPTIGQADLVAVVDRKAMLWNPNSTPEPSVAQAENFSLGDDPPRISANGKVMLFKQARNYVTWSMTQHKQMASLQLGMGANPVLSADGSQVLALTLDGRRLVLLSSETGEQTAEVLAENPGLREFALSPDAKRVLGKSATGLLLIDVETHDAKPLTVPGNFRNFEFCDSNTLLGCSGLTVMKLNLKDNKLATWNINGGDEELCRVVSFANGRKLAAFGTDENSHGRAWIVDTTDGSSVELLP